jgi:hypothetical protein
MKNPRLYFLVLFFLWTGKTSMAQSAEDSTKTPHFVYCELIGTNKIMSTKMNVSLDKGEERRFFQDTRMRDDQTGKVQSFNSIIDAMNYMAGFGWEFVQAYTLVFNQQNIYHWVLRKKV